MKDARVEALAWGSGAQEIARRALQPPGVQRAGKTLPPNPARDMQHAFDPVLWAKERLRFERFDPWQEQALLAIDERYVLLNCTRQGGKSTVTSISVAHLAIYEPGSLQLVISPSLRQSIEMARKIRDMLARVPEIGKLPVDSKTDIQLGNGSRIVSLPSSAATIRGFSAPRRIVVDESAFVDDQVYEAVRPMLARSENGALWLLSTPFGQRGFFWKEFTGRGNQNWKKFRVTALDCPGISREHLEAERQSRGDLFFRSEYMCEFVSVDGSLFDLEQVRRCITDDVEPLFPIGQQQAAWATDSLFTDLEPLGAPS